MSNFTKFDEYLAKSLIQQKDKIELKLRERKKNLLVRSFSLSRESFTKRFAIPPRNVKFNGPAPENNQSTFEGLPTPPETKIEESNYDFKLGD
jgi:hypothetical protein